MICVDAVWEMMIELVGFIFASNILSGAATNNNLIVY